MKHQETRNRKSGGGRGGRRRRRGADTAAATTATATNTSAATASQSTRTQPLGEHSLKNAFTKEKDVSTRRTTLLAGFGLMVSNDAEKERGC